MKFERLSGDWPSRALSYQESTAANRLASHILKSLNGGATSALKKGNTLPFAAGQYIDRPKKELPILDSVIELYLVESLKCF